MDSQITEKFEAPLRHLQGELASLRTGRATPALVETLNVDYYGVKTPLMQLASISVPDAKTIVVQPWDPSSLKDIEKAFNTSSLGIHPVNEGKILRIVIPPLTTERREELIKAVGSLAEEARVGIRNLRESAMKDFTSKKTSGELSEDEFFRQQKSLQQVVDEKNRSIKLMTDEKEKELREI